MDILVNFFLSGLVGVILYFLFEYLNTYYKGSKKFESFVHNSPRILLYFIFILFFSLALYFVAMGNMEFKENSFSFNAILDFVLAIFFAFLAYRML